MRKPMLLLAVLLFLLSFKLAAQRAEIDQLHKQLTEAPNDSFRWFYTTQLSAKYMHINFDTSRMYGEQSVQLAGDRDNGSCMGRSLNTLGAAYWIKGDHETALKYYFQALEYCKSERMKEWESTILGNIGIIYTDRKEYDRALQYLHRALSMKSALKDSIGLVRTMNNIGKLYTEMPMADSALVYYYACLPYFDAFPKLKQGKGIVLNNIGSIFLDKNDFSNARRYFEESLKIREEIGDKGGMSIVFSNLGQMAQMEGKHQEAISYFEQSLELSHQTGSNTDLSDVWKKLSEAYREQKNYAKAYEYLAKYTLHQDTLYRQEAAASIANMEIKYQTAQKVAEIKALESENRIHNIINYTAVAGIMALLIVLWLSRRTYRQRRQLQQATIDQLESERKVVALNAHLEGQQRERLRIAEDLHDDFGSGLSKISLLSELAKKKTSLPEFEKISSAAKELLLKMSEIVWALNHRNDTLPSLAAYIRRYASAYFEDTGIRCLFNIPAQLPESPLSGEVRRNIFLVVKETLHNTLKHAEAGRVEITFSLQTNNLVIQIADNGKGFDQEAVAKAGNGLINMEKRMLAEGGHYLLDSEPNKGTITRLTLPLMSEEPVRSSAAA